MFIIVVPVVSLCTVDISFISGYVTLVFYVDLEEIVTYMGKNYCYYSYYC